MPRPRKSVVFLCLAAALLAAFAPGSALVYAILTPTWELLPPGFVVAVRPEIAPRDVQLLPLLSLALSRAPPLSLPSV